MAAVAVRISHKKFRALIKKHRRKLKRQILARSREEKELKEQQEREKSPNYCLREAERQREEQLHLQYEERERERMHRLWLVREQQAQAEFQRKKELAELEAEKKNDGEEDEVPKEEEEVQHMEKEQTLKTITEDKKRKEDALKEAVASLPEGNEPWHNPLAPENYNPGEKENCSFFMKTGCCRFGDRCSRSHLYPSISCTLLIKGMFSHFSIGQMDFLHDEYDADIGLEFDDKETYQDFLEFYEDVLPEFKKIGRVVQFKVCCNHEPHLRGNVYIQYAKEKEAEQAYAVFNGRWYAGKQISCEYTNVIKWKGAICGLFHRNRCPKGKNCNFLHVFKNPRNEFWAADNDIQDAHSTRNGPFRHRKFRSSGHYRSRSRSPARKENSQRRNWKKNYSPKYFHYRDKNFLHSDSHRTRRYTFHSTSSEEDEEACKWLHSNSREKRRSYSQERKPSHSKERRQSHSKKRSQSSRKQTLSSSSSPSSETSSSSSSSDEKSSSYSKKKLHKRKKRKEKKAKKHSERKSDSSSST